MPKVPRDLTGAELIKALARVGYRQTRQSGSHVRLTALIDAQEHHLTVPLHSPLKTGTLAAILADVATALHLERNALLTTLFG